jgi:hypothetical protein
MDNMSKPPNEAGKDRSNGDYQDKTINLQQLFSSFFFGFLTQFDDRYNVSGTTTANKTAFPSPKTTSYDSNAVDTRIENDSGKEEVQSMNEHNIEGVLDQIEKLTIYKSTLHLLQWQRDNYLVGDEYADWRKKDRLRQEKHQRYFQPISVTNYTIPYNPTTISHHHISSLASSFIPTAAVQNLLTPIVTELFVKETGVLFDPIKQSTINLILDQEKLLEDTIKNQLLQHLDNPSNLEAIKDSTQGIIIQTAKIDNVGPCETK